MDRFLGTGLGKLFEPAEAARLLGAVAAVLEVSAGGRPFEARVMAMEPGLALLLFRDISAEKQAERLKSEFMASVSHELKTPPTNILGFTELLGGAYPQPEARQFLEHIRSSTLRLADRVNNLLDSSRLEAGRFEVNRQPVQLEPLLREVAASFTGVAGLSGTRLVLEVAPLPEVRADPERLAQLVGNLLANALKFCPPGGTVWLRAWAESRVRLEVEDTGPGIPPDERASLFERFSRGKSAQEHGTPCPGLGLYISKAIVEAHGGHIWLAPESEPCASGCLRAWKVDRKGLSRPLTFKAFPRSTVHITSGEESSAPRNRPG
jgi:signal transduction histidine kinase